MDNERVFIVGLPRTGSTLLRTILNRSERVCIAAETHFLTQWSTIGRKKKIAQYGDLQVDENADRFLAAIFSPVHTTSKDFWGWLNRNVKEGEFRDRLFQTDRSERAVFDLFMQISAEKKKGPVQPDWILGEKTAANIYYVPTLVDWFPCSKIIHTFRDPRGIFTSSAKLVQNGKWGVKQKMPSLPERFLHPVLDSVMAVYVSRAWLDAVRLHNLYERQYPGRYLLVRFEDVIRDPEGQVQRACQFLGIPFDPDILSDVKIVGSSYQASRIVPGGVDQAAGDRWKEHIPPLASAWFSLLGRKQLKQFGYLPEGSPR